MQHGGVRAAEPLLDVGDVDRVLRRRRKCSQASEVSEDLANVCLVYRGQHYICRVVLPRHVDYPPHFSARRFVVAFIIPSVEIEQAHADERDNFLCVNRQVERSPHAHYVLVELHVVDFSVGHPNLLLHFT